MTQIRWRSDYESVAVRVWGKNWNSSVTVHTNLSKRGNRFLFVTFTRPELLLDLFTGLLYVASSFLGTNLRNVVTSDLQSTRIFENIKLLFNTFSCTIFCPERNIEVSYLKTTTNTSNHACINTAVEETEVTEIFNLGTRLRIVTPPPPPKKKQGAE